MEIGQEEKICEIQERELNVRMLEKQIKSSQETVYELQQELDFKRQILIFMLNNDKKLLLSSIFKAKSLKDKKNGSKK